MSEDRSDDDVFISLTAAQASRRLTVGEFVEAYSLLQNQINSVVLSLTKFALDDREGFVETTREALDLAEKSEKLLGAIANGTWGPADEH